MQKKLLLIFIFSFHFSFAQDPLVKQWDYRFGGADEDFLNSFQQTADGGYVLAGFSQSPISGDKSKNTRGLWDYWMVKIDSIGTKKWDKDLGGTEDDRLYAMQQTTDGGYILAGSSNSGISGDKSEANWDSVNFSHDFWIVKTDTIGNRIWDKDFGGTADDNLVSIQQTTDGGYILGGSSNSRIGGDKTQPNWDTINYTSDFWIVKLNSSGNKQWDKDFGTTGDDQLTSVRQTSDGGYILAGQTSSGISGDKTQPSNGQIDYWIIKVDSLGNKLWDSDFGGSENDILYAIKVTADGGCVLAGVSSSGISGNKTQPNWDATNTTYDYWIVKVNSTGIMQWDKDFGGTLSEPRLGSISQTLDGGYLATGISYSSISGNKTESNLGIEQIWVVKTDSLGTIAWDKTVFTIAEEEFGYAIQSSDGCYITANGTPADVGGDKTQSSRGFHDYWIAKFCDSTLTINIPEYSFATQQLTLFPNPTSGKFILKKDELKIENIAVYNMFGKQIDSWQYLIGKKEATIDVGNLPAGVYILQVRDGKKLWIGKVVKE